MKKQEQILVWGGIVLILLFLVFGLKSRNVIVQQSGDIVGPQLGGLELPPMFNNSYRLGDINISRGMDRVDTGTCGCTRGGSLELNLDKVDPYVVPPLPPVDKFVPKTTGIIPPLPKITVYKDANYGSKALTFRSPVSNMNTTGLGLNDGVSSIRATGRWELFEHAYFKGRSIIVDGDVSNLASIGFNDVISSLRPA